MDGFGWSPKLPTDEQTSFLGPRGPLRTPLMPVPSVVRPKQKITQPLVILFLFQTQAHASSPTVHSKQNTEQDHLADLSSPIWSCFSSKMYSEIIQ